MAQKITAECTCEGCGAEKTFVSKRKGETGFSALLPRGWRFRPMAGDGNPYRRARTQRKLLCGDCNTAVTNAGTAALKKRRRG